MRLRLVLPVLVLAALLTPTALAAAPAKAPPAAKAQAAKKYVIFGSCGNGKPFKASSHCRYDKSTLFRGTFVFESKIGKRPVKTCFRIYGAKPLGGGHACVKLGPTAYKAYPFKISGVRQKFAVKVAWFVKSKGGGFKQVGASFMKVRP